MAIYFLSLVGFLAFYGLEHLHTRLRETSESGESRTAFRIHIGGFAAYVFLMGYLLVHNPEATSVSTKDELTSTREDLHMEDILTRMWIT
jgi:hypothetical protein